MESDAIVAKPSELPQQESSENEQTSSSKQGSIPGDFPNYKMDHPKRGLACIFIHSEFDFKGCKITRPGAEQDENMLTETLNKLDFQVITFKNLTADEIHQKIAELRINKDLNHHDCLLIAVSSHGEDGGKIYAYDKLYDVEDLWTPFTADKCHELAGKPKLFFIQACRGPVTDKGTIVSCSSTATDGPSEYYSIPTQADFLFAYSTIPGYVSYRNRITGSKFIKALCDVLTERGRREDLLSMMTVVLRSVAVNEIEIKKLVEKIFFSQMPCFTSQLIRRVYFHEKISVSIPTKRCRLL